MGETKGALKDDDGAMDVAATQALAGLDDAALAKVAEDIMSPYLRVHDLHRGLVPLGFLPYGNDDPLQ